MRDGRYGAVLTAVLFLFLLATSAGCGAKASADADRGMVASLGVSSGEGLANRHGVPITGGDTGALADEDADEEEAKDYWAAIDFDRTNFEEVRQQVRSRYIESSVDEVWAYAQAAAWALASHDSGRLLLPESFYRVRKDHPDEKGRLLGKVTKLHPNDGFVLLDPPEDQEEEERRRLDDDEIRETRQRQQARARLLRERWRAVGFGAKDFDRVMAFIQRELRPVEGWTVKRAWIAAAQGYLHALDPHSSLVAKAAWEDSNKRTTDSSFDGIGAVLTRRADSEYTVVESPIQGQPAVEAGLRAGDVIIRVDGADVKGEPLSRVVSRIRGPRGTRVVLSILREGEPEPKDIAIERQHIQIRNVQARLVDQHLDLGYIKVTGFVRTTDIELERAYRDLERQTSSGRLRGLILDLRNNSGGLLNQGIDVANRFLSSGTIVSVRNRNSRDDDTYVAKAPGTWEVPLIVLVNDGTASAAEIVASAVQDNQRGLVVGDRTFGKASVQTLYSTVLQDDYFIKLTVARYYSPSGRTLQVTGVVPDVTVTPEIDGKLPVGFREENLSGHLVPLDNDYVSANAVLTARAAACVEREGVARRVFESDPNPAIKFDYQLMYSADLLECVINERAAAQRMD